MDEYLSETSLLDFSDSAIQRLIEEQGWKKLPGKKRIRSIYQFVRDKISFGFNEKDELPASQILDEGYGQCNTKSILFMALLRAVEIPCRLHGFTIKKTVQQGLLTGFAYRLAPPEFYHTWVEVLCDEKWHVCEGIIIDTRYLKAVQKKFQASEGTFYGYGIAVQDLKAPPVDWNESDTFIQKAAISGDLGIFDDPDHFFKEYSQSLGVFKQYIFVNITRHKMNRKIRKTILLSDAR